MHKKSFDPQAFAFAAPVAVGEAGDGDRQFSGVAYSGGLITDHPFWEGVVFDLQSTKIAERIPVLYRHGEPIGVVTQATMDGAIKVDGKLFTSHDETARSVASKGDGGLAWQMSVGIYPKRIQQVGPKESVMVNGKEFSGPIAVFRDAVIREASFVPLGADSTTSAHVFARSGQHTVEVSMSDPDTKDQEIVALKTANDTLKSANEALQAQVADLNAKFEAQRTAQRAEDVKALFAAVGMEFSDAVAKPFVEMGDEQFAATRDAMTKLRGGDKPDLFSPINTSRKAGKVATFAAPAGHHVDEQALALHERAVVIAAEKGIEYYAAVQIAEKE